MHMKPYINIVGATLMLTYIGSSQTVVNNTTLTFTGNPTVTTYESTGGTLNGAGTYTATTFDLDDATTNSAISGTINTEGNTFINNTALGALNVQSGTTQLGGLNVLDITVASGAALDAQATGLENSTGIANAGTINFTGNQTIQGDYSSNNGTLSGGTLTADSYDLAFGATVDANLGAGDINTSGDASILGTEVTINGTSQGNISVDSGITNLNGANAGTETNITNGATLIAGGSNLLAAGSTVENEGTLTINGDQTVSAYNSGNTILDPATLSGTGTLTADTYDLTDGAVVNANLGEGVITTNDTVRLAGEVAGDVTVESGLTLLTGDLSGDANINDGATLNAFAGSLGATTDVDNAGTLYIQANETINSYTSTGVLTGATGTEVLTAGTYNLNDGSETNLSLGAGNIITNGTIALNQATAGTILVETGTTTLSANNTGNSIAINQGATLDTGVGTIDDSAAVNNSGTLTLNGNETVGLYTASGTLQGSGLLTASGYNLNDGAQVNLELGPGDIITNGAVSLNQASAGNLTVQSGTTALNGNNAGTNVNINSDATLEAAGGTIASGAGVVNNGTLSLTGDQNVDTYSGANGTLNGQGTLSANNFTAGRIETTVTGPSSTSLSINAANVALSGNSELALTGSSSSVSLLDEFELFQGDTNLANGFSAFDTQGLDQDVRAVFNQETGNIIIIGVGDTAYESSTANVIDALLSIDPDSVEQLTNLESIDSSSQVVLDRINSILSASPGTVAEDLVCQLTPVSYSALNDYATFQHLSYSRTIQNTARVDANSQWELAVGANHQAINGIGKKDYDLEGSGGFLGVYANIRENMEIGLFGAIDRGSISSSHLDLDSTGVIFGASYEMKLGEYGVLNLAASTGSFEFDGTRTALGFENNVNTEASTLNLEAGYKWLYNGDSQEQLAPFVKVNHLITDIDSINETGSAASIQTESHSVETTLISLGVEGSWRPTRSSFGLTGRLAYTFNLSDDDYSVESTLANGQSFSTDIAGISGNFLEVQAGAFYQLSDIALIDLVFYTMSNDSVDSSYGANAALRFFW